MTWGLVRKLLRDVRVGLAVAALLLFLFQLLWSRVTERVTSLILPAFGQLQVMPDTIQKIILSQNELPGQMIQAVIGGENIKINHPPDLMSISYVHPLTITILCMWAIGRAANAIAGELDRGTMELLMAQPIRRTQIIAAPLLVDVIVFAVLCGFLWLGTCAGTWMMGLQTPRDPKDRVDPMWFLPALAYVAGLLFAVSGVTMWLSSLGRSRARVWGWAVSLILTMFLVNVLGQVWSEELSWIRPYTIFYHYQPQLVILAEPPHPGATSWLHLPVLVGTGAAGYLCAWVTFCRRDLPAPL